MQKLLTPVWEIKFQELHADFHFLVLQ